MTSKLRVVNATATGLTLFVMLFFMTALKSYAQSDAHIEVRPSPLSEPTEIPFHLLNPKIPRIIVYLSINDSKKLPFLVDTGFNGSLLLFKTMSKQVEEVQEPDSSLTGNKNSERTVVLNTVDLPAVSSSSPLSLRNLPVLLSDWEPGRDKKPKISGLIGLSIFHFGVITVNFDKQVMTLSEGVPAWGKYAEAEPCVLKMEEGLIYAKIRVGDRKIWALLDTGSEISTLPSELAEEFGEMTDVKVRLDTIEGALSAALYRVSGITLGDQPQPPINAAAFPSALPTIGLDILSRYNFSLDIANLRLYLVPRRSREIKANPAVPAKRTKTRTAVERQGASKPPIFARRVW